MKKPSTINHQPSTKRILAYTAIGAAATLAAGWYFADELVKARPVVRVPPPTKLLSVTQEGALTTYRLSRNVTTARRGVLTVNWDDGRGGQLLGDISAQGQGWVERPLLAGEATLMPSDWVRPSSVGLGNPASRGLKFSPVTLAGEHGDLPAWWVPAKSHDWVIIMHGYQGLRQDALRFLPAYHRLGLHSLTVTYRNAHGAGRTPQGVYRLGAEEWQDLEVAAQYAREHGARRIVLMGLSMGGSITMSFMRKSPLAQHISGVVLDSPALEWREILRHHAQRFALPTVLAGAVEKLTTLKAGQDFDEIDHLQHVHSYQVPMLVFHGSADQTVPVSQLDRLHALRPDLVDYVRLEGGEHLRLWNLDPQAYETQLARFLGRVLPQEGA